MNDPESTKYADVPDAPNCHNCAARKEDTLRMRYGPAGPKTLCNACGLFWATQGRPRPANAIDDTVAPVASEPASQDDDDDAAYVEAEEAEEEEEEEEEEWEEGADDVPRATMGLNDGVIIRPVASNEIFPIPTARREEGEGGRPGEEAPTAMHVDGPAGALQPGAAFDGVFEVEWTSGACTATAHPIPSMC
jgi:hypothetical protein